MTMPLTRHGGDAGKTTGNLPTVFHRKNNTGWKVTMDAADWFKLYREWEGGREAMKVVDAKKAGSQN